jgi:predicted permease
MSLDIVESIQILGCNLFSTCLGPILCYLKKLTEDETILVLGIVNSLAIPSMNFRQTAIYGLEVQTWLAFLLALLVQLSVHILALVVFALPIDDRYRHFFNIISTSTYSEIVHFALPVIQVLFAVDESYLAVQCLLVNLMIVRPVHRIIRYRIFPPSSPVHDHADEEEDLDDGLPVSGNPITPLLGTTTTEDEPVQEPLVEEAAPAPAPTSSDAPPLWRVVLWSIVTPSLIGFILGLIWSVLLIGMSLFLEHFSHTQEVTTLAPGLIIAGMYVFWFQSFTELVSVEIVVTVVLKLIVMPFLAMMWAVLLQLGRNTARILVLVHAATSALISLEFAAVPGGSRACFVATTVLALPMTMAWIAFLNVGTV